MAILIDDTATTLIKHPEELQTETVDAAEELVRDFFDDVWARGNIDHLDTYLDDHFYWNASPGYENNREGYGRMVQDFHQSFPDLFADLEEVVSQDGTVAAHWCMAGHHQNDWMGIPATGNAIRVEGLALDTVVRGRIASELSMQDTAAMMLQLDVSDLSRFK